MMVGDLGYFSDKLSLNSAFGFLTFWDQGLGIGTQELIRTLDLGLRLVKTLHIYLASLSVSLLLNLHISP